MSDVVWCDGSRKVGVVLDSPPVLRGTHPADLGKVVVVDDQRQPSVEIRDPRELTGKQRGE